MWQTAGADMNQIKSMHIVHTAHFLEQSGTGNDNYASKCQKHYIFTNKFCPIPPESQIGRKTTKYKLNFISEI